MKLTNTLVRLLQEKNWGFASVVAHDLTIPNLLVLDLTDNNNELKKVNLEHTPSFTKYLFDKMLQANTPVAIGRYNEDRIIYRKRSTFIAEEPRSIHLGIDIWAKAGTPVYCPLPGKIHSFKNNKGFGDYGPTIIVEHYLETITFFSLYGHLSIKSLSHLIKEKQLQGGEKIGDIGNYPENGDWPPHLHFQLITDMQGFEGDFPGVAARSQKNKYLQLCPDPNLILGIPNI